MSNPRATEYRQLIDDVIAGGLLEEDEWIEIKELITRVTAKLEAARKAKEEVE